MVAMVNKSMAGDFPDGIAVVIGGSGGIGQGICLGLADKGCNVALTYRHSADAALAVLENIHARGLAAEAIQLELGSMEDISAAFSSIRQKGARIHSIIYAVGANISMSHVASINPREWYSTIESDLNGFFRVVKSGLPFLREGGGGSIVAITSAGLARHPPMDILSVAPKAAIEALIRGIAREEGRFNIRANSVAPGVVDGGLFDRIRQQVGSEVIEAMRKNTALGRFGTVKEIADVVVFLASDGAGFVTGQHLVVDGGYSV